ncbi:MAG: xanthine/uracil/vitamin C permease [Planctomycetota bacterium]|nr:MAG: xanthine/uracil/vitamin C permease [Planctomycetota bacterium]
MQAWLERRFRLSEHHTTIRTELLAGVTTFATMAYIVFVNPGILSAAGVPFEGAVTATALGAALMCVVMGFVANKPLALASGMGLNAMIAFSVIGFQQKNVPWQVGMSVIVIEGVLILLLVLAGLREAVMHAIPRDLKRGIGVGIGLFLTMIGLSQGGLIAPAPITLVTLGRFDQPYVWVTLIGLLGIVALMAFRLKLTAPPSGAIVQAPSFDTFFAVFGSNEHGPYLWQALKPALLPTIFGIMLTDFFDTMGSIVAVGEPAGFVKPDGTVPGLRSILLVDSAAAAIGGVFGASSMTTYIESAAGVAQGGRTGLMPVMTGLLFVLTAFCVPIVKMVGGGCPIPNAEHYAAFIASGFTVPSDEIPLYLYPITAGALIAVGFLMMHSMGVAGIAPCVSDDRRHSADLQHFQRDRLRLRELDRHQTAARESS